MSLALLTLGLLCAHPARAQYPGGGYPGGGYPGGGYPGGGYPGGGSSGGWVPSPTAYIDSNGLVCLGPPHSVTDIYNTYKIAPDADPWWFTAYSPNQYDAGDNSDEYSSPSLLLNGRASNWAMDPYQRTAYFFDPLNYGGDRDDSGPLPPDLGGSVTAKKKAPLSVDFTWTGPGPVPDHADFLLLTHLSVSAGAYYGDGGATSGLSATAKAKLPDQQEEVAATAGDAGWNSTPTLNGRHLVRVTPNGNIATVSTNGEVEADTSNSLPYATWVPGDHDFYYSGPPHNGQTEADAFASISATASYDSRDVTISCFTIEDSYYKGAYDSQHGTDRYLHQRNSDGSIQTDSVAFYGTADNDHGWNAGALFDANTPGFTNPTYSWSSDFNPVTMLDVDTHQSDIIGSWYFGSSDKLPTSSTVTLNVQDGSDSLSASNTFDIKWHLPYEAPNPVPYLVMAGKYSLQPARLGPVYDGHTALVQATQPQHLDWEAAINGASVVAKVAGQEEIAGGLEIVGAIAKIAKPYTDVDAEKQEDGATNGPTTWGDAQSENQEIYGGTNVPDSLKDNPNGWKLCKMYIFQVVHYKDKYWYADGYNSHGYDGTSTNVVYLRNIDSVYDEFQFIQYKNPDGSPYPGT